MRRMRRGSNNDVIIDLTSLLDVMFIILLVVLCGQSTMTNKLSETQEQAEYAITQAEEEKWLYENQQEMVNNVWAISIIVPYDENEITKRQIRFLIRGEEIQSIDLVGNDVTDAIAEFKDCLQNYIEQNKDKPVILSLNENDDYILYRDEVMVNGVFDELVNMYSNVYVIKGNIGEEIK